MKHFVGILALAAAVGLSERSGAAEFSYSYLQLGGAKSSSKGFGGTKASGQVLGLTGSFEVTDNLYAKGSYSTGSTDYGQVSYQGLPLTVGTKQTVLGLTLGYHIEPAVTTSMYAEALILPEHTIDLELGYQGDATDVTVTLPSAYEGYAYGIALGLRQWMGERVEVEGQFSHIQVRGDDEIFGTKVSDHLNTFFVGGHFHTGMGVSVGGGVGFNTDSDSDSTQYGLLLRYHF